MSSERRKRHSRKRPLSEATAADISTRIVHLPQTNTTLRIIEPYMHTFASFAKARWIGRTLLDVYSTEFGSYPPAYYKAAILDGRILVSGNRATLDYRIKGHDELSHTVHRHEPAVAVSSSKSPFINIVKETDTVVALDKPSAIPIHPCGGYHKNSLFELLGEESGYGKLYTIHRLDRLTSGLVIAAKTSAVAKEWGKSITDRDHCEKLYLARVRGHFGLSIPDTIPGLLTNADTVPKYGEWDKSDAHSSQTSGAGGAHPFAYCHWVSNDSAGNGRPKDSVSLKALSNQHWPSLDALLDAKNDSVLWLHLACPVRITDPKHGVCEAGNFTPDVGHSRPARSAQTAFTPVVHDAATDTTVVLVRPATGRTHQIRIHLQHLGHPIANDPNYSFCDTSDNTMWFENPEGAAACAKATALLQESKNSMVTTDEPATAEEIEQLQQNLQCRRNENSTFAMEDLIKATCVWCARDPKRTPVERATLEFQVRSPGLWLHALQYTVNGECLRTAAPKWALVDGSSIK